MKKKYEYRWHKNAMGFRPGSMDDYEPVKLKHPWKEAEENAAKYGSNWCKKENIFEKIGDAILNAYLECYESFCAWNNERTERQQDRLEKERKEREEASAEAVTSVFESLSFDEFDEDYTEDFFSDEF